MANAQTKQYLKLAAEARDSRERLFYKLMAEVAPAVGEMARRNKNQVGATIIYDIVLRVASSLLLETAFNLSRGAIDIDRLTADFRTALEQMAGSFDEIGAVPFTPKLDG